LVPFKAVKFHLQWQDLQHENANDSASLSTTFSLASYFRARLKLTECNPKWVESVGLYYRHIKIVNDNSRVVRMTLQVLTTLEVSFTLLEKIYRTVASTINM